MSHIYKQVAKPADKPMMTIREAVTKHGDLWRLLFPTLHFVRREHMECNTQDSWEAQQMEQMERGERPRIRDEDMRGD